MVEVFAVLARLGTCACLFLHSKGQMRPLGVHSGSTVNVGPSVVRVGLYRRDFGIPLDGCCTLSRSVALVLGDCACMGLYPGWGSLSFVLRLFGRARFGTDGRVPIASDV